MVKMSILKKLKEVRVTIQETGLKKSGSNKHLGFSYYELGDILPTVNRVFNEIGLLGVFSIDGEIPFAQATLTIYDVETEDKIIFQSPTAQATLVKATPVQELGAVHTYLKRYLYLNALELVEPDILDNSLGVNPVETKATPKQIELIKTLMPNEEHIAKACETYNVKTLEEFTMTQASELIKRIQDKRK